MAIDPPLPFEEGQLVETKCFVTGFRGAWFRCEIKKISSIGDRVGHVLFYPDFPDEKEGRVESYQVPPSPDSSSTTKKRRGRPANPERQLMLRPAYPPIYRKDGCIPSGASAEVRVVVEGGWHVGDPVDWLKDDCYWSGKLTHILDKEKATVELLPPPLGEGYSYEAKLSDLRPTLDWSLETGWTVPSPEDAADFAQRVQIMYPVQPNAAVGDELAAPEEPNIQIEQPVPVTSPDDLAESERASPMKAPQNVEAPLMSEDAVAPLASSDKMKMPENAEASSVSEKRKAQEDVAGPSMIDRIRAPPELPKLPMFSDTDGSVEAVIMDFEQLGTKLSFLQDVLKHGYPLPDNASSSSWEWEFVNDHRNPPNP